MPFLLSTAEAVLRPIVTMPSWSVMYFYCLPLRRYWDTMTSLSFSSSPTYFYCLPLRRYWDNLSYRSCITTLPLFLLSTAEAVLRQSPLYYVFKHIYFYCLPLRRYWDSAHETQIMEINIISIVYRWGGIETPELASCLQKLLFLLSIAEAVLNPSIFYFIC